jgi:hypothetical protein
MQCNEFADVVSESIVGRVASWSVAAQTMSREKIDDCGDELMVVKSRRRKV